MPRMLITGDNREILDVLNIEEQILTLERRQDLNPADMTHTLLSAPKPSAFLIRKTIFQDREKSGCCQPVKKSGKNQVEHHPQKSIHDAKNHCFPQPIDPGTQHQGPKAVHRCFIPVIGAKSQAHSAQRPHQWMESLRCNQKKCQKCARTRHSSYDPLTETG